MDQIDKKFVWPYFISRENNRIIILAIYVEDGLIFARNQEDVSIIMEHLRKEFQIHEFKNDCYLGIEYKVNEDSSIFINQKSFFKKIIGRFKMDSCETISTPLDNNQIFDEANDSQNSQFPYRQLIGSLLFLSVVSRPDITYAVAVLSQFLERPKLVHVNAAKRVIRYLKGTMNRGIQYLNREMEIFGYCDADYAGDITTRKSTSGYVFVFAGGAISCCSERQRSIALSSLYYGIGIHRSSFGGQRTYLDQEFHRRNIKQEEFQDASFRRQSECNQGNIGSGKSTFLNFFNEDDEICIIN